MGSSPCRAQVESSIPSHLEGAVADEDERPLVWLRQLGADRGRDGKSEGGVEGWREEVARLVDRQVNRGKQRVAWIGEDDQVVGEEGGEVAEKAGNRDRGVRGVPWLDVDCRRARVVTDRAP